jgi:hypothetical protein
MFAASFSYAGTEELLRIIVVHTWSLPLSWSSFYGMDQALCMVLLIEAV